MIEALASKLIVDLGSKTVVHLLTSFSRRYESHIEDWTTRGVLAFEDYGSIPDNSASEDLEYEIREIGLEIDGFYRSDLLAWVCYPSIMLTVSMRIQNRTQHLKPRLAGDFLNYAWHGIGGWIA